MYTKSHILPSPKELKKKFPLTNALQKKIFSFRDRAKNICLRQDLSFAMIVGPCSIHHEEEIMIYAKRLKKWMEKTSSKLFLVLRAFVEKPRSCLGWKGFLYDPFLDGSHNLRQGIEKTRKLFLALAQLGIPLAMEIVDPLLLPYFEDLVTWGFIGARTSSSQIHRQVASSAPFPIGFKNYIDGDLSIAVSGAVAAERAHTFLGINSDGKIASVSSKGNLFSHIVLRGSFQKKNFYSQDIRSTLLLMQKYLLNKPLLVDCSHGNSEKIAKNQRKAFFSVLEQRVQGTSEIMGAMLESYINEGKQNFSSLEKLRFGVSITDDCIGWEETEELLAWAFEQLSSSHSTLMEPVQS